MLLEATRSVVIPVARMMAWPRIEGADNVPRTGGLIVASNHLSFIDSMAIPVCAPRPVRFIAKDTYWKQSGLKGKALKNFFEFVQAVPVDRESPRAAQESLDVALTVLQAGEAFGIYPEGTRSLDGALHKGRTGVGWLALESGVPVVPVGLVGTDRMQPVGTRWPRPTRITVRFGKPMTFGQYADLPPGKARRLITDDVMNAIGALSGQKRSGTFSALPTA